ncbi:MAG: hypothetical protein ACO34E_07850, partial [Limisphaerales bacterium]
MNGAAAKERSVPFDPQVLMGIKSLELRARAVVEGFWSGLHRSPYHGFSHFLGVLISIEPALICNV